MPNCESCSLDPTQRVPGEGISNSPVVWFGEGPGFNEVEQGRPFVGVAGKLLRDVAHQLGFSFQKMFLSNVVLCRPPGNRDPKPNEVRACWDHVEAEIAHKPKVIVTLGATALHGFLANEKLADCHGTAVVRDGTTYFPCYHPSWAGRSPDNYGIFYQDLQSLRLFLKSGGYQDIPTFYPLIDLDDGLKQVAPVVAFDFETESLDVHNPSIVGVSFSWDAGQACYIPVGSEPEQQDAVFELLRPIVTDCNVLKICHHVKYEYQILLSRGIKMVNFADTMILANLMGIKSGSLGLKSLSRRFLGVEMTELDQLMGKSKKAIPIRDVLVEELGYYSAADSDMTLRLYNLLYPQLDDELRNMFDNIECPLAGVLAEMEFRGVRVDPDILDRIAIPWKARMAELEEQAVELVGHEINLRSPKQKAAVLYDELHLPVLAKTDTGQRSTDAKVIAKLKGRHPLVDLLIEYGEESTRVRTFIDGYKDRINPVTGQVHSSFNQTRTDTGRLSSAEPNVQNAPRQGVGWLVRTAFVPSEPDWIIWKADYAGQEPRITAHLSQDEAMLDIYRRGEEDYYTVVGNGNRQVGKVLQLAITYGASEATVAEKLEENNIFPGYTSSQYRREARKIRDGVLRRFPRLQEFIDRTHEDVVRLGYVETMLGRRRWIPQVLSHDSRIRASGFREDVNSRIQGSAAVQLKLAMLALHPRLQQYRARMLIPVHDEIVGECHVEDWPIVKSIVEEYMVNAMKLDVPVEVEIGVGSSWGEAK